MAATWLMRLGKNLTQTLTVSQPSRSQQVPLCPMVPRVSAVGWTDDDTNSSPFRPGRFRTTMAVLEDGLGSPMMDISEAVLEEEEEFEDESFEEEEDDDMIEEDGDSDDEDDEAFLARMQEERLARLAAAEAKRPPSARRARPESAHPASASRVESVPEDEAVCLGATRVVVGATRSTGDEPNEPTPVSATRPRSSRGGLSSSGRLTQAHNEFTPYDPHDPLAADPFADDNTSAGGAYGAPAHDPRGDKRGALKPKMAQGREALRRSPYGESLGDIKGGGRAQRVGAVGTRRVTEEDILGSVVDSLSLRSTGMPSSSRGGSVDGDRRPTAMFDTSVWRSSGRGEPLETSAPLEWWSNSRERTRRTFDTTPAKVTYPAFAEPKTPSSSGRLKMGPKPRHTSSDRVAAVYGVGDARAVMARALSGRAAGEPPAELSPVLMTRGRGTRDTRRPWTALARPSTSVGHPSSERRAGSGRPTTAGPRSPTMGPGDAGVNLRGRSTASDRAPSGRKESAVGGRGRPASATSVGALTRRVGVVYEKRANTPSAAVSAYDTLKPMFGPDHRSQRAGAYEELAKSGPLTRYGITMKEVLAEQRRARAEIARSAMGAAGGARPLSSRGRRGSGDGFRRSVSGARVREEAAPVAAADKEPETATAFVEDGEDDDDDDVLAELDAESVSY